MLNLHNLNAKIPQFLCGIFLRFVTKRKTYTCDFFVKFVDISPIVKYNKIEYLYLSFFTRNEVRRVKSDQTFNGNPTTVDGLRAIEMRYRSVFSTGTKEAAFCQSSIRLNSPDMGVLLPDRFMPVLESDDRCVPIFKLALLQTVKAAEKFTERELDFNWISVFMPLRLLAKNNCLNILTEFTDIIGVKPNKICFEISPLLLNDDGDCRKTMKKLRKAGYHTMITNVGGNAFPLLSLAEFEPEYVMMDEQITQLLGQDERSETCAQSVISFINNLDAEPIATGVPSAEIADRLYELECSYYTGAAHSGYYTGNFQREKFMRTKNQQ